MKGRTTRRFVALAVVAATAAIEAGAVAQNATATTPGKNGKLAFRRYLDNDRTWGAIFVSDADGTGLRQVTRPKRGVVDDQPD